MATLSVTTVNTGNATTDFTLTTGNTAAGDIVLYSNGYGIILGGNSSTNTVTLSPNGNFVVANSTANNLILSSAGDVTATGALTINTNNKALRFNTVSGTSYATMIQQNDDNFVFYSTNTAGGQRAIWSVYANSVTSNLVISSNVTISTNTLTLGTSTAAANGYTFLPNGLKMVWGMVAAANTAAGTFATYASAFTTATYVVQVSHQGNARTVAPLVVSSNTTGANISSGIAATTGTNVYFIAIGI